MLIEEQKKKYC